MTSNGAEDAKILSSTTLKCLRKGYFFSHWLNFHPYAWTGEVTVCTGRIRKLIWHGHMCCAVLFYVLLLYQCYQVTSHANYGRRLEQLYVIFLAAYYFIFVVLQLHTARRRYEMARFVRCFLHFTSLCEETYFKGSSCKFPLSSKCGALIASTFPIFWANGCCIIMLTLVRTFLPESMTIPAILPFQSLGQMGVVVSTIFEVLFAMSYAEISIIYASWALSFVFAMNDIIGGLRSALQGKGQMSIRKVLKCYKSLFILTDEFSGVFFAPTAAAHLGLIFISTFCAYGAVNLHGAMSFFLGWGWLNMTSFLGVILSTLGNINHVSKEVVRILKKQPLGFSRQDSILIRKETKCLLEMRIRMGSTFYYDKILLLTTFQIILQATANLLLLH